MDWKEKTCDMTDYLTWKELIYSAMIALVISILFLYFFPMENTVSYKEAYALYTFKDDIRNNGMYIQDFKTGKWYDIDADDFSIKKNSISEPLSARHMAIPNIRERIMDYYINKLKSEKS